MKTLCTLSLLALFAAGCSKDGQPQKPADPKATGGDPHANAERIDLGTVKVGEFQVLARRGKDLKPGDEAEVDIAFLAGKLPPGTVRGWIGVQDVTGSVKAAFKKEGDGMHGHVEVPKPVPAGSKLWIEIESGGTKATGSFDLKQ